MSDQSDTRSDEEKARAVDAIFEEAGFEFVEDEDDGQTHVTYVVAPRLIAPDDDTQ